MKKDLTQGSVMRAILVFTWPMLAGNLLQQFYNMADTVIVGKALGSQALAAAFLFVGVAAIALQAGASLFLRGILGLMQTPDDVYEYLYEYMKVILFGIPVVFLYNYFAYMLRAVGNSLIPLVFLGIGTLSNIGLDILFVLVWKQGVWGAALATVLAQGFSGVGIAIYSLNRERMFHWKGSDFPRSGHVWREVMENSLGACIQQSIMNFGILMVQGLVNSFGTAVMAAFAVGVKIDAFAYMPVQEFGNAFSVFIAQNHGGGKTDRIRQGVKGSVRLVVAFCLLVSLLVLLSAPWLMTLFLDGSESEIIAIGAGYLRIEGAFYWGIGLLFLLYGYFRGVELPVMSVVLTVISLGTRVAMSYLLAPRLGYHMIWCAIPVGWVLADAVGLWQYRKCQSR